MEQQPQDPGTVTWQDTWEKTWNEVQLELKRLDYRISQLRSRAATVQVIHGFRVGPGDKVIIAPRTDDMSKEDCEQALNTVREFLGPSVEVFLVEGADVTVINQDSPQEVK